MDKIEIQRAKIKAMKKRHNLTNEGLTDLLYKTSLKSVKNWSSGRRGMPPEIWRRLVQELDGVDIKHGIDPYKGEEE